MPWHPEERHGGIDIVLPVSRVEERVTVTAAGETPQPNVATVDREMLETSGAMTVEGTLREVPGFKLFRRTPGWSTNGTTGGVSLRGVGANAASRALVLEDGIPAADPYGAWVYWGQFAGAAIDRIEVVQGSESDLYGSEAMGGVINIIRKNPLETWFTADTTYGSSNTPIGSAMGAVRVGKWNVVASGEGFNTNGYMPLAASERGAVDTVVNSEHRTGDLLLERLFGGNSAGLPGRQLLPGSASEWNGSSGQQRRPAPIADGSRFHFAESWAASGCAFLAEPRAFGKPSVRFRPTVTPKC